jgi:hypothetical protein
MGDVSMKGEGDGLGRTLHAFQIFLKSNLLSNMVHWIVILGNKAIILHFTDYFKFMLIL